MTNHFFEENKKKKPHELIKRMMYKKYLQAFIPVTQKYYSTVIIDGFAGPGRYKQKWPSTIEKHGSPIIALIVALQYLAKTHRKIDIDLASEPVGEIQMLDNQESYSNAKIRLYFVESKLKYFNSLCKNVKTVFSLFHHQIKGTTCLFKEEDIKKSYQFNIPLEGVSDIVLTCEIHKQKFQEFGFPNIDTTTTRCMTFLDPFGYKDIPMDRVQTYVGEGKEVLITLMSGPVHRYMKLYPDHVANLFGIDIDKIREELTIIANNVNDSIRESQDKARKNLQVGHLPNIYARVLTENAGSQYSLIFEMKDIKDEIMYHLVFITNHFKGVKEMKESMNRCTQEPNTLRLSDYKVVYKDYELSLKNNQNPADVANSIFQKFRGTTVELDEVEQFVSHYTPYVFRKGVLGLMEKETHPRLCQVRNICCDKPPHDRKIGEFPARGKWELTFRADETEHGTLVTILGGLLLVLLLTGTVIYLSTS